jgi:hypothetical protein
LGASFAQPHGGIGCLLRVRSTITCKRGTYVYGTSSQKLGRPGVSCFAPLSRRKSHNSLMCHT